MYEYKEGATEPVDLALESRNPETGAQQRYNCTGATVVMLATGKNQATQAIALAIVDAEQGEVRYAPAGELVAEHSPYRVSVRVTRSDTKYAMFPQAGNWLWKVSEP